MTPPPLFDGAKIAELSRAARLPRRKLATMIGACHTEIKSLETGRNTTSSTADSSDCSPGR